MLLLEQISAANDVKETNKQKYSETLPVRQEK